MIIPRMALLGALVLAACGGGAPPAAQPSPTPAPTASPTAVPTAAPTVAATSAPATSAPATTVPAPGGVTFTVAAGSKAVVRVTEQLADRRDLSDAVLTTEKLVGELTLLPDGTFAASSKLVVDLTALISDSPQRDTFVKRTTLETGRFPQATFVPTRSEGLALPLPASGELAFKLVGQMTIHGVTNEVAFDVRARRSGADLSATATATPPLRFGTFGMQQPRVFSVLSIKDEIRLEVQLVAKLKS